MVKTKRITKRDTESDTDTENDDRKVMNTKGGKGKKTKLYMMIGVVLLVIVIFMWYRRKSKAKLQAAGPVVQTQVMQQRPMQMPQMAQMGQMPQMPQMQMGGMQQRLNPIQEIQLTQH